MDQEPGASAGKAPRSLLPGVGSYHEDRLCLSPQDVVILHQKFLSLNQTRERFSKEAKMRETFEKSTKDETFAPFISPRSKALAQLARTKQIAGVQSQRNHPFPVVREESTQGT